MTINANNYVDSYNNGNFLFRQCTVTTSNIFTRKNHGLIVGDRVQFATDDTKPTGISVDTWYYVISTGLTSDDFEVSATKSGSSVTISAVGSGQLYFAPDKQSRLSVSQESCR